jgi:ubiquitin-conjugating enzyme E2 O
MFSSTLFYCGQTLVGPVSELENAKWINQSPEMRTSRKHKTDRKFTVQSVEVEGVFVNWQCKASCEENTAKDSVIPKSYITGEDLKRMKRLNLFESCMLQINDKNYLEICESDLIVRKSQWKKEQSKTNILEIFLNSFLFFSILGNKYRILSSKLNLSTNQNSSQNDIESEFDNQNIKLTKSTDCEHVKKTECDRSRLCPLSLKLFESDEWQTEEEEEEVLSDSGTTASSCSSNPTPKGSPKKSPLLSHKIRKLKKYKQRDPKEVKVPQVNDRVVTEALVVYSWATVVWQDGSIESEISSVELCPIHHLDDHEFFPADFVLAANDAANANPSYRDYGVIQKVDHLGRIARVKWFSTYTNIDEPQPLYKGESEVSVYDLKDHPDFQYRPGTIVIRVANFPTENCATAGQVVDNYPEGRVKVWWVDGTITMCWPQDLFEVGQYDSENNFWGNGGDSDDESWQTEDEFSEPGGMPQQQHLTANLERARKAMARLEELFIINPNLQSQEVMKKLLMVYKKCRYLDRLMNTSFFHESNFMGLVERVRKSGSQTTAERLLEKKNRLFNEVPVAGVFECSSIEAEMPKPLTKKISLLEATKSSSNSNSHEDNSSYCSFESTKSCFQPSTRQTSQESPTKRQNLLVVASEAWNKQGKCNLSTSSDISSITDDNAESHKLSLSSSPSSAYKTPSPKRGGDDIEKNSTDSGILITLDNGSTSENSKQIIETSDSNSGSFVITVCAKLCSLIKMQLVKALQEINNRYCPSDTFKEIVELEMDVNAIARAESEFEDESSPDEVKSYDLTDGEASKLMKKAPIETQQNIPSSENFQIIENVTSTHKFHLTVFHPTNAHAFFKAVQKEHKLLRSSLPPDGVWVRSFEDRLDLLSVLIEGPKNTPYEDGLFAFDIQLGHDYPSSPPLCHYISYCSDRLNPNLYEDGKVCVSLLVG